MFDDRFMQRFSNFTSSSLSCVKCWQLSHLFVVRNWKGWLSNSFLLATSCIFQFLYQLYVLVELLKENRWRGAFSLVAKATMLINKLFLPVRLGVAISLANRLVIMVDGQVNNGNSNICWCVGCSKCRMQLNFIFSGWQNLFVMRWFVDIASLSDD